MDKGGKLWENFPNEWEVLLDRVYHALQEILRALRPITKL